ncbi:hypothetical protein FHG87_025535 [Trinorchestia longiramus]|nr:hypothetical protein FHG87_025535 [Trinorchestia longiramus]
MKKTWHAATKMIPKLHNLSNTRSLEQLESISPEHRRPQEQVIEIYKQSSGNIGVAGNYSVQEQMTAKGAQTTRSEEQEKDKYIAGDHWAANVYGSFYGGNPSIRPSFHSVGTK